VKVRDPVCGMTIDAERAAATGEYDGETVYFCAVACRTQFERQRAARAAPTR
jgi:Cu+-exporting ATPase